MGPYMLGMCALGVAGGQGHVGVHIAGSDTYHLDLRLADCRWEGRLAKDLGLHWLGTLGALESIPHHL